jgi:hypothetical protein
MKKVKNFGTLFLIAVVFLAIACIGIFAQGTSVYAEGGSQETTFSADSMFSNKTIATTGYLYNFDGSADYIYIIFAGTAGYAIFAEETMELLEYAAEGSFP